METEKRYFHDATLSRQCPECKGYFGDLQNIIKKWTGTLTFGKYTLHTCPHCGVYVLHGPDGDVIPDEDEWFMEGISLRGRKRNIEWSNFSWNWESGCPGPKGEGRCEFCYAHRISYRLKGRFGYPEDDPFRVVLHPDKLYGPPYHRNHPLNRKKPCIYFNVSMGDWLADGVKSEWRQEALRVMAKAKQHLFVTLTKQYANLWQIAYDSPDRMIPPNVIVGVTVTRRSQIWAIDKLRQVDALVRLVCYEPMLEDLSIISDLRDIHWIIIGAQTRQPGIAGLPSIPYFRPERGWVQRLVWKAKDPDLARPIPVFIKPNMGDVVKMGWFEQKLEEMPFKKLGGWP